MMAPRVCARVSGLTDAMIEAIEAGQTTVREVASAVTRGQPQRPDVASSTVWRPRMRGPKARAAAALIRDLLASGPRPQRAIQAAAAEQGISPATVICVARVVGVLRRRGVWQLPAAT